MGRILAFMFAICLVPMSSRAHPGHMIEVAGHDHLLAGAAIAIAVAVGLAGLLAGKRERDEDEVIDEAEEQEAEAT